MLKYVQSVAGGIICAVILLIVGALMPIVALISLLAGIAGLVKFNSEED